MDQRVIGEGVLCCLMLNAGVGCTFETRWALTACVGPALATRRENPEGRYTLAFLGSLASRLARVTQMRKHGMDASMHQSACCARAE
eukprot:scaffold27878_cov19-Tisochrysis_lutea.AAC.2